MSDNTRPKTEDERENDRLELEKLRGELILQDHDIITKRLTALSRGIFRLNAPVRIENVTALRERIELFTEMYPERPLTLYINSGGGSITAGYDLYSALREASNQGHHVTTKISGLAASMAGIIAQAGDTRIITAESWMMIHTAAQWTGYMKSADLTIEAETLTRMGYQEARIYTERAGDRAQLTTEQMFAWFEHVDRWITADTALTMGYVDRIE